MTRMAVITPSYAPDLELCADLNRSVLRYAPEEVRHHIVVPASDLGRFERLGGPRTSLHRVDEFLPRQFVRVPGFNGWVNLRRPFPPVRGWIAQQIVKLAAAAAIDADVALLVDSDIRFLRPFDTGTYLRDGVVRFYRKPDEIDERMPRHLIWHRRARALLGLPPADPPYHDYVCSPVAWDRAIVNRLLDRIREVSGRPWQHTLAAELHFSEVTLYGVFVDEVLGSPASSFASDDMRCHNHYDESPLDGDAIAAFLSRVRPDDLAVMISAKSGTPLDVRRTAFDGLPAAGEP